MREDLKSSRMKDTAEKHSVQAVRNHRLHAVIMSTFHFLGLKSPPRRCQRCRAFRVFPP